MAFSRYQTRGGFDSEYQPGSHGRVLLNKAGIIRKREMDRAEFEALLTAQSRFVSQITNQTRFTDQTICDMHSMWLGDLYAWAGCYRTVQMMKGDFRWPPAQFISHSMRTYAETTLTECTPCSTKFEDADEGLRDVAAKLAIVHAELLLIHPFRDGNGRIARWLADLMALQAGFALPDYGLAGRGAKKRQAAYMEGVKQGYVAVYEPLTDFFVDALRRGLS